MEFSTTIEINETATATTYRETEAEIQDAYMLNVELAKNVIPNGTVEVTPNGRYTVVTDGKNTVTVSRSH